MIVKQMVGNIFSLVMMKGATVLGMPYVGFGFVAFGAIQERS